MDEVDAFFKGRERTTNDDESDQHFYEPDRASSAELEFPHDFDMGRMHGP